jgi:hypothetical protein
LLIAGSEAAANHRLKQDIHMPARNDRAPKLGKVFANLPALRCLDTRGDRGERVRYASKLRYHARNLSYLLKCPCCERLFLQNARLYTNSIEIWLVNSPRGVPGDLCASHRFFRPRGANSCQRGTGADIELAWTPSLWFKLLSSRPCAKKRSITVPSRPSLPPFTRETAMTLRAISRT